MIVAALVVQVLYAAVGVALALLVLVLIQYQYGSVGNLLRRWTMSEFRHIPQHQILSAASIPHSSAPNSPTTPSREDPAAELLKMQPLRYPTLSQPLLSQKRSSTDPVIQKMKQQYGTTH